MRILITNDDGIHSQGIWVAAAALKPLGDVLVCAPDREQSGRGAAVTLHGMLRYKEISSPINGVRACAVEGTPGDAVIMAMTHISNEGFDLVVSGINSGQNLGDDVFISGTVGGAMHGYFNNIPAFAVSVAAIKELHLAPAASLIRILAERVQNKELKGNLLLNINLPNVPLNQLKGIRVTRLGQQRYGYSVKREFDGRNEYFWILRGPVKTESRKAWDSLTLDLNQISITALLARSDSREVKALKSMAPGLFLALRDFDTTNERLL
jgi:5'-nucleotidase